MIFKPAVPASDYDMASDDYSWDWARLHLVQMHRFAGDRDKGATSGIPWLKQDLAANAADGRPVILFQHYGWDKFSLERWDPPATRSPTPAAARRTGGAMKTAKRCCRPSQATTSSAFSMAIEHDTPMIYRVGDLDVFKPKASFMGGFALVRVTATFMDVVLAEVLPPHGNVVFTNALSKPISVMPR